MDDPEPHSEAAARPAPEAGSRALWDAFISYSHRADTDLAPALRDALHKLAKPWHHKRAMRVFLDEASLSADPTLWTPIARAIDSSSGFVVLLSPDAAASVWVNREIQRWVDRCGSDRLFPVLTRGELVWSERLGDFDPEASSALPEALRGVFAEEPRHIDLRWADGRSGLTLNDLEFRDAVADLAAPLRNMAKDELIGSDLEEHQRAIRLARTAIVVLSVLLVAALVAAVFARRNAVRADARRIDAQAARLRLESLRSSNRPDAGFLLAAEAYRLRPDANAATAVITAVQRTPDLRTYVRVHSSRIVAVGVTQDSRSVVSLDQAGLLVSTDVATGTTLAKATVERKGGAIAANKDHVIVTGLALGQLRDARTLEVERTWAAGASEIFSAVAFLDDGRAAFARQDGSVATAQPGDDAQLRWIPSAQTTTYALAASAGSTVVTAGLDARGEYTVDALSLESPAVPLWRAPVALQPTSLGLTADRSLVIVGTTRGAYIVLDAKSGKPQGNPSSIGASAIRAVASSRSLDQYQLVATDAGELRYIDATKLANYPGELVHNGAVTALAWSGSGIAASGGADGVVTILNTGPNRAPGATDLGLAARAIATTSDGARSLAIVGDEIVELTSGNTADRGTVDAARPAAIDDAAVVPKAGPATSPARSTERDTRRTIARITDALSVAATADGAVVGDEHGTIHLLTSASGARGRSAAITGSVGSDTPLVAVDAVADGRIVSLTSSQLLQVWRVRNGALVVERTLSDRASAFGVQGGEGPAIAYFDIDSGLVVADLDGTEITRIPSDYPASVAVAIDPSGRTAVSADASILHVWDLTDAVEKGTPIDAQGDVRAVRFVDGGRNVVMVDSQSSVKLVDVRTRSSRGRLADEDGLPFVAFSATDTSDAVVVSSSSGGVLRAVRRTFDPAQLIADGCALFGRPFNDGERTLFDLGKGDGPCAA
jgi:WD40 repeat protein